MSTARIYQLDFTDLLAKAASEGGVDLVVTSPPYCDARAYNNDVNFTEDDYARLGDVVFAALKPGGHCIINVDAPVRKWRSGVGTERGLHPWRLLLDWADRIGFRVPDRLAFGRHGLPGRYAGRFRNDWEPLLWFQRPGAKGYFDKTPLATDAKYDSIGKNIGGRRREGSQVPRNATGWAATGKKRHRGTMWEYGPVANSHTGARDLEAVKHPARFPFRLADDVVQCFAPPDGLVCDPFLGGGTSMIAALHNGRNFIGGDRYENKEGNPWVRVAAGVAEGRWGGTFSQFQDDAHEVYVNDAPAWEW